MFLNLEDLTKVSHRDFKGLVTDKRIPRKEKDYRDKWSTSSSAALRKTCSPQFKLFNVCIGWFFFLQHCSFYNAWLQLSEKHVELIISYQGFSTTVFFSQLPYVLFALLWIIPYQHLAQTRSVDLFQYLTIYIQSNIKKRECSDDCYRYIV